ncbi:ribonuclease H-like domain-containing protein [Rhizophagus irregularis DAOM 181602=DAOM 197198]|nr:ribonuclease H-like domain-containing protein [Rhizophagus irregularis DAOM 181602=DAOM 197198]
MQGHIALNCLKVSPEVKSLFLEKVKNNGHLGYNKKIKISHNQPKIDEIFDSIKIDQAKIEMANRAIVKFFACCGIPFHIIENPFFIDLLRTSLTEDMLNAEISHVITEINLKLNNEKNLTLDTWTSTSRQSLYAFVIITGERKEYIHSVQNLSNYSHTGEFLANKIIEVIENVGVTKFAGIVSDNASTMVMDICKLEFAQSILKKCMKLVHFFKASHRAGAELTDEIKENIIKGGKLKGYCQTRWMTACDCVSSVLRCEEALKNVEQDEGEENFIQQLALKIFSITPHNARCERIFSVMGWYMNKRRTRVYQLVRNGIYQNINDEIREEELDNEDEDYGDTEEELVNIEEYEKFGHKSNDSVLQSENYFNFVSKELVELLKLQEPRVVIKPVNVDHIVDHGNENFDIEKLLDQQFSVIFICCIF